MMEKRELENMCNYFLDLERELADSSRYIEPEGQEKTYSFEFRKLIILSCTEFESACKALCEIAAPDAERGNIGHYKSIILSNFPKIVEAETHISRWHRTIRPLENWNTGILPWWDANQQVKHDRGANFQAASYENAVYALSAVYILICYLSKITGISVPYYNSQYIHSNYGYQSLYCPTGINLPDFDSK